MSRSNSPQALSVVSVVHEGDVESTAQEIMRFDGKSLYFSHDKTWNSMAAALRGVIDPASVAKQFLKCHPRIVASIRALCEFGWKYKLDTRRFSDFPHAGLKEVEGLRVDEEIVVVARATCWFIRNGKPIIPILQPRLNSLSERKLAVYLALARRAYCKGDWLNANIEIFDLAGSNQSDPCCRVWTEANLAPVNEVELNSFLQTFVTAQKLANKIREQKKPDSRQSSAPLPLFMPQRDITGKP